MALTTRAGQGASAAPEEAALRVVLDTNVLLSLWVFTDSRFLPFLARLRDGHWRALTNGPCHSEFVRVLRYPMFALDGLRRHAIASEYLSLAEMVTGRPQPAPALPLCKDPDDQKFLELARDGAADWLITSDKALLKLGRRGRMAGLFRIVRPEDALAETTGGRRPWAPPERPDMPGSEIREIAPR